MTYHLGLDPKELIVGEGKLLNRAKVYNNFKEAGESATALKIFGDESTGGNNIPIKYIPEIARSWAARYPKKPVILHLEDGNVRTVLELLKADSRGGDVAVHIAHVSSQQELEAVIWAKEQGMNVTCEVTPHHLFANEEDGAQIGGYGSMKPTLKSVSDVKFLWANIGVIDMFASDCAPHKVTDKEAEKPAYGVTNHTTMLPLLFGAVDSGLLTMEQLYDKVAVAPRKRFNIPSDDGTHAVFDISARRPSAYNIEKTIAPLYGQNIFPKLEQLGKKFHLLGRVVSVKSGQSHIVTDEKTQIKSFHTSMGHLL